MAEWLCSGLQNRVHRFNSGPGLHQMRFFSYSKTPCHHSDRQTRPVTNWRDKNPIKKSAFISSRSPRKHHLVPFCCKLPDVHYRHRLGATFIAQKTGMETIGPMGFTFGRYLIGAGVIIPFALYEARKVNLLQALKKDQSLNFAAFGLGMMMFGGIGLQQTALLYTNVANAAFLTALYVPLVPLIAAFFLRRHVPINIWPAVLLIDGRKLFTFWHLVT